MTSDPHGSGRASAASGTGPVAGGRRRVDRVLSEEFLRDLADLPFDEVRARRREAEQEDADLSYVRRMLQGRADLLRAEVARRAGQEAGATTAAEPGPRGAPGAGGTGHDDEALVAHLAAVLSDETRTARGMGRFLSVEPSRVDEHRRQVEQVIADVRLADPSEADDEELVAALDRVQAMERDVSATRRQVQGAMDALTAEVARRYREGEARVEDLLGEG